MPITLKRKVAIDALSIRLPVTVRSDIRAYVQWATERGFETTEGELAAALVQEGLKSEKEFQTWRKQNPDVAADRPTRTRKAVANGSV